MHNPAWRLCKKLAYIVFCKLREYYIMLFVRPMLWVSSARGGVFLHACLWFALLIGLPAQGWAEEAAKAKEAQTASAVQAEAATAPDAIGGTTGDADTESMTDDAAKPAEGEAALTPEQAAEALAADLLGDAEPTPRRDPDVVAPTIPFKHGLSTFGELKYAKGFKHFAYVRTDAPKGGSIKLAYEGSFDSLNPFILRGVAATGIALTFDTLLSPSADEPSTAYGLLADGVKVDPDHYWVEFRLNPAASWPDGSAVTAEDVAFSFTALTKQGHPHYQSYYLDVAEAKILDKRRVRFLFKHNQNRELPLILGQLPVLPKAWFEDAARPFDKPGLVAIPGSGPYRVERVDAGRSIRFQRREDYWAKEHPVNIGRHNFDRVTFDYYRDEAVAVEALKAGAYDVRLENISRLWATAYDTPALREGLLLKRVIPAGQPAGAQGFYFNTRLAKFADVRVRKALTLAFDFEWTNSHLFYGLYQRTLSYYENSPYAARGLPSEAELRLLEPYREQLPEATFAEPLGLPQSDGSGYIREPLLQARDLLREAGWVVKDFQLVHAESGEPLTIEFMLFSPSFQRVVAPYIKNLERLGIQGRIRMVDIAQYQKRVEQFDFESIVHIYPQSLAPGNEQVNYFHSRMAGVQGSLNVAGMRHPVVDALVEKILKARSQEELEATCMALDRVLWYQYYMVPHWFSGMVRLVHWDKFGMPEQPPTYGTGFYDLWWYEPEKASRMRNTSGGAV